RRCAGGVAEGGRAPAAPAGTINNLKAWFADNSALAQGCTLKGMDATSYTQATGDAVNGTLLNTSNYASLTGAPVDVVTTWTSAAKKDFTGSTTITGTTGVVGNYLAFQLTD